MQISSIFIVVLWHQPKYTDGLIQTNQIATNDTLQIVYKKLPITKASEKNLDEYCC